MNHLTSLMHQKSAARANAEGNTQPGTYQILMEFSFLLMELFLLKPKSACASIKQYSRAFLFEFVISKSSTTFKRGYCTTDEAERRLRAM